MKKIFSLIVLALFVLLRTSTVSAETLPHEYTGAKKCSMCHKTEKQGQQYSLWLNSRHAQAFNTLGTPRAKEIGAGLGVADPQTSGKCLKCHSTAYGFTESRISEQIAVEEGVSCETCHGPGQDYSKMSVMKDRKAATANGMSVPDKKTCLRCHDAGGPVPEKFDFDSYWKKIRHPRPRA